MKIFMFSLLLLFCVFTVNADMGRITTSDAVVSEDAQQAIIFHNLEEEILILGTDLKADKKTTILRFIPFPSEPTVSLAEGNPFQRVSELMKEHNMVFLHFSKSGSSSADPVEITFSAKIGAHDITVICINEIAEFKDWVAKFLKGKGLAPKGNNQQVVHVASDYVKRKIKYFVFDLVEITPEAQFVEPIAYRFKSREFYYPLKTSNTFGGSGGIDLIIVAPGTLCDTGPFSQALYMEKSEDIYKIYPPCLSPLSNKRPFSYPVRASTTAELSREEIKAIYAPAKSFFKKNEAVFMQLIRYYGEYDFDDDILIDISKAPKLGMEYIEHLSDEDSFTQFMETRKKSRIAADPDYELKKACLEATMVAIQQEIFRFEDKYAAAIEGPGNPENAPGINKQISELDVEYEKYGKMHPTDYKLPEMKTVKIKTTQQYQEGSILELKNMSRSGPFYHIAGILGNDYESVKSDKAYQMTIYPVYHRDYPFPSEYVYIADF